MTQYDVIVIGGGASGLIAAGRAGERGLRVLLLEKNKRLGEKLRITGGGRCNITNTQEHEREFLKQYGRAEQSLYSLFAQFGVKDTFSFFQSHHLPLVIEAYHRAFPKSQKAEDVVRALETYLREGGVTIKTNSPVTDIDMKDTAITAIHCGKEHYTAHEYIFATGSLSYPETGSTGDGFSWLQKLGHTVIKPTPTVVPLAVKEKWIKELAGVSLTDTKITFYTDGKKQFHISGKVLCTHFGLSGPLILNNAYRVADILPTGTITATIDVYPHNDLGTIERNIISVFDVNKNKILKNIIKEFVPEGLDKGITTLLTQHIDVSQKVHSVSKEDRKMITRLLKALPVTITGLMGFNRAVVADGGVPLKEIDMRTMRSKKIVNLFIAGDLLHINRPSGGYSLQLCWTTGYVAGTHAGTLYKI